MNRQPWTLPRGLSTLLRDLFKACQSYERRRYREPREPEHCRELQVSPRRPFLDLACKPSSLTDNIREQPA